DLIVYMGANAAGQSPLLAVRPDRTAVDLPAVKTSFESSGPPRFLPDGSGLVYVFNSGATMDFWMLDLATKNPRLLARLNRTLPLVFDITSDGKQIVFDRRRENSDIQLIDLKR